VLGVSINITEQKRAKEEVARMRLYLKNIIDSMPSVLIGVDPWGYITVLNQPAEQVGNLSWEAAQGRFFGDVFPQLEGQFEQVRQAIRLGQPIKTPRMTLEVDSELHYADVMVYPLMADGASGAVIRLDDVTGRVRIESMMVQTEKMLSVGGLAAGMAHEINNPLGAILQGSQNIQRRIALDMPQNLAVAAAIGIDLEQLNRYLEQRGIRHFLEGIREAGVRAAKIVADMLSFSRGSESHFAPVDLEDMLETVLRLAASDYDLKKKYDFKRLQINRDYDPALRLIYCDKTEIEQVILNLLKNAAQAMTDDETLAPAITLRTRREADWMDFRAFFHHQGGWGRDRPGVVGVLFHCDRTASRSVIRDFEAGPGRPFQYSSAFTSGGIEIMVAMLDWVLIVDDETMIRENLKAYLEDEGLRVAAFEAVIPALDWLGERGPCRVCIMDMRLPDMDGNSAICTSATHRCSS